jgi:hypothetical protein
VQEVAHARIAAGLLAVESEVVRLCLKSGKPGQFVPLNLMSARNLSPVSSESLCAMVADQHT